MNQKEDQFLDLIAENAQLKEEIKSIQEFNLIVQLLDRDFLRLCRNQILEENDDISILDKKISYLRNGMRPINSAEAWKNKLKEEIFQKQNQSNRSICDSLLDRRSKSVSKMDGLEKDITNLQQKVDETRIKCQKATAERNKLKEQIEEYQNSLNQSKSSLEQIKSLVEIEQASSIKIKKTMEETAKSLYSFSQATSNSAIQPSVVESIKELQSYLDSSAL